MAAAYEIAPIFLIRLAGVPFGAVQRLATPETIRIAREIMSRGATEKELRTYGTVLSSTLKSEVDISRSVLIEIARTILPDYLVFGSADACNLLSHLSNTLGPRNHRARDREQHLLLYLQRLAAKNDIFSRFGPTAWGKIESLAQALRIEIAPGVAAHEVFLERWTAHSVAGAINADMHDAHIEVPALDPHAFDVLFADIAHWPDGAARQKWMPLLEPIAALPEKFAATEQPEVRQSIMDEARQRLRSVGAAHKGGERFLYAATNPIGEECLRNCDFTIGQEFIAELTTEAEPWIDFWRDSYAFIASRVAASLRQVLEKVGGAATSLPEFLRACEAAKLPLSGPGLVAPAHIAFQEIKAAFRERMKPHADKSEYALTAQDCHLVRDNFHYDRFDEYTYPSADVQIAAKSVDAVSRGEYQWLLAELHPPAALLHHCMYWGCPDKPILNRAFARMTCGRPNFHFGFFAADFTAHTCVRLFDALPDLTTFVASERANPNWRRAAPAEVEVYVDETNGDVCLRQIHNHEYLGSFARAWIIPLGFHPFQFGMAPHMPRLRCGKVIVQRRTWVVRQDELPNGNYTGLSRTLLFAVEKLRTNRQLPRFVYIRPTEQALRRSGVEGRDKDTKPVFVDLESYLFLEVFYRWLVKSGELEITEMLPDPDHLLWQEPDGRHTFELRTLVVPRS